MSANPNDDSQALLTTAELAAILKWHPNSVRAARSRGRLPIPWLKIGTRDVRYRREDVEKFLEANTVKLQPAGAE